ncbi:MAG: hypothetical protein K8R88_03665 [Armatimonadetes bacterium]|nr:hypothetical protein [Armatimonadota bacterium]
MKKITLLLFATLLLTPTQGGANTYSDNFNDGAKNPALWSVNTVGEVAATEQNGRLELFTSGWAMGNFSAEFLGVPRLVGDFDIKFDFDHILWPSNNGIRTGISVGVGGYGYTLERTCMGTWGGESILSDVNGNLTVLPYEATTGALRLVRVGNVMTGYYYSGGWHVVSSVNAPIEEMSFKLWSWSGDQFFGHQNSVATFDNFVAVDSAQTQATLAGKINLTDYVGDLTVPELRFTLRNTNGVIMEDWTQKLGATGTFSHPSLVPLDGNGYILTIRGSHWLGKAMKLDASNADSIAVALVNGDANGDNVIDLTDYTIVATAFNALPSSANWDARADFNGDEVIDLTDYTVVVTNFNAIGDY